jgi:MSHA biogenesis protein MshE
VNIARKKLRLGDLLVESKIISQLQLDTALEEQRKLGRKLGRILVDKGYLTEDGLLTFLSRQLAVPFVELSHYQFEPAVIALLPEIYARRFRAIALKDKGDSLLLGMSDPTNLFAYDELARIIGRPIDIAVVREQELLDIIERVYKQTDRISGIAEQLSDELREGDFDVAQLAADADLSEAPVVKLLHTLFQAAVQARASDIHIEPDESVLRIRQRIDGVLLEQVLNERRIAPALVQRLKLMSQLDIAEKRLPQDGRFSIKVGDRLIDVRVSTMPLQHGESVVMRLLDHREGVKDLDALGMPANILRRFMTSIRRPHGMVVVTGPTGSGKTSTLYSALKLLNEARSKIVTVEDPVEYRLPRVNQIQVNPQIGLTFARVLRTTLRQDPDIILVGEMRDQETVEIGLRAAITGHLVLTTLHTNDAISTISRLLDMGAPNYLLASALHAVIAQRLVRKVCGNCAQPEQPTGAALGWLRLKTGQQEPTGLWRRGTGCHQCSNTGYRGRIGIYEMLVVSPAMSTALAAGDFVGFAELGRSSPGYRSLELAALDRAAEGVTSIEEAIRVAAESLLAGDESEDEDLLPAPSAPLEPAELT